MTRQTCNFKHPTILQIQRSQSQLQMLLHLIMHHRNQSLKRGPVRRISSALVSLGEGEGTGSGKDCILAITPVQVKLRNGSKSILTYAFLDPGSTDTFCAENPMRKLNASGRRTEVLLQTMGTEETVNSCYIF